MNILPVGNISKEQLRELSERIKQLRGILDEWVERGFLSQSSKISSDNILRIMQEYNAKIECLDNVADKPCGVSFCIPDGNQSYFPIFIDRRINNLNDGTPNGVSSRIATLRETVLHELSHVILHHRGAFTFSANADDMTRARVEWKNQCFLRQSEESQNKDAELLATMIGFWPLEEFKNKYRDSKFNLREIADEFKMSVESAAQWALIQFYQFDQIHYAKRIEKFPVLGTPGIESSFMMPFDVFSHSESAAAKAVNLHEDCQVSGEKYNCRAFFISNKYILGGLSDEVLVFGRLINKIYEG